MPHSMCSCQNTIYRWCRKGCLNLLSAPLALIHDESRKKFELISGGPRDLGRELSEVVEALVTESMYDDPINILVGMHCDISKADRCLHLARKCFIDDSQFCQRVEYAAHRFRSRKWGIRNHDGRNVDANLHGSCEIERDDIPAGAWRPMAILGPRARTHAELPMLPVGVKKAASVADPSATPKKVERPKGSVSSLEITRGHIFAIRPRVNTGFPQNDLLEAKRALADEVYGSLGEAARAVAEEALSITRNTASRPEKHRPR